MSIASEITRLQGVKADILDAIADKGVTVPAGSALDDCPALIDAIQSGGGNSFYYPLETNIITVDSNGYIGIKRPVETDYTYTAILNSNEDYSQEGLGRVSLLPDKNLPIDTITIGQNLYGVIQIGPWLIIDQNLHEAVGTYLVPDSQHSEAGYFYLGSSLWDGGADDFTQDAKDFCANVGSGWSFITKEFVDWIETNFSNYSNDFFRKETYQNGNNILGMNVVAGRYSEGGDIYYSAAIWPGRYGYNTKWIEIGPNGRISFPVEGNVLKYYNPNRLIKKLY